jgi:hypothetical protein
MQRREMWAGAVLIASMFSTELARAEGHDLDAVAFHEKVRLDGLLREWPHLDDLSYGAKGIASGLVGYDDSNVYVAMKVNDRHLVRTKGYGQGEDVATLVLAFPGEKETRAYRIDLFPGEPGRTPGAVKLEGKAIAGAKLVEAPLEGGFTFEASIPWSTFAEASLVRVGLTAALEYSDRDRLSGAANVAATSPSRAVNDLPLLNLEAEAAVKQSLLEPKGLPRRPSLSRIGDVAGDPAKEKVAIYGRYLVMVGSGYRGGKEYYFQDLGVDGTPEVKRLTLTDLTGDGKAELVLQKRITIAGLEREILQVFSVSKGSEEPVMALQHEVMLAAQGKSVKNKVSIESGKKPRIVISQGEADSDLDPKAFEMSGGANLEPALMPWDAVQSQFFEWTGQRFDLVDKKTGEPRVAGPGAKPKAAQSERAPVEVAEAPAPPRPPTPDELLERVYALYKTEHDANKAAPRFDFAIDAAGDARKERVLVHGKDLVVFGKGFQGGSSYVYLTIGVEDPADIVQATAFDVTGDGKAEVIVYGQVRAKASKGLGGGVIQRQTIFVYQIRETGIKRVFSAETGRASGDKFILGSIAFKPKKGSSVIELGPGRAVGWTEKTYPFPPDRFPYGGFEPLLLPWTDLPARRYVYDGNEFTLQ